MRKCLHCGSTVFYVKQHISGSGYYYQDTAGEEADNTNLHSSLTYKTIGKYAYCADCNKRFARISDLENEHYFEEVGES